MSTRWSFAAPTRIAVFAARDMARELGAFRVTVHDEQGVLVTRIGKHLVAWEKRGGQWRVMAESLTQDQPSAAPR